MDDTKKKFPNAYMKLELDGPAGNVFVILGRAKEALADGGATPADITEFMDIATSGDYDGVIALCKEWMHCLEPHTDWIES